MTMRTIMTITMRTIMTIMMESIVCNSHEIFILLHATTLNSGRIHTLVRQPQHESPMGRILLVVNSTVHTNSVATALPATTH